MIKELRIIVNIIQQASFTHTAGLYCMCSLIVQVPLYLGVRLIHKILRT